MTFPLIFYKKILYAITWDKVQRQTNFFLLTFMEDFFVQFDIRTSYKHINIFLQRS